MQSLQSKVSVVCFFFFLFFKIEFTRNKTSSCLWGPCLLQNLQRLPAWTRPLWGLQTYLKLLEKKNGLSKGNNEVKPRYYFIILSFHPAPIEKCLKVFSVGCSLGRDWRGLAENSQYNYDHETICLTQFPQTYFAALMEKAIRFWVIGFSEMSITASSLYAPQRRCAVSWSLPALCCLVYLRPDPSNYWDESNHIIHSSPPAHLNTLSIYLVFGSGLNESFNNPCSQQVKLQPAGSHNSQGC